MMMGLALLKLFTEREQVAPDLHLLDDLKQKPNSRRNCRLRSLKTPFAGACPCRTRVRELTTRRGEYSSQSVACMGCSPIYQHAGVLVSSGPVNRKLMITRLRRVLDPLPEQQHRLSRHRC